MTDVATPILSGTKVPARAAGANTSRVESSENAARSDNFSGYLAELSSTNTHSAIHNLPGTAASDISPSANSDRDALIPAESEAATTGWTLPMTAMESGNGSPLMVTEREGMMVLHAFNADRDHAFMGASPEARKAVVGKMTTITGPRNLSTGDALLASGSPGDATTNGRIDDRHSQNVTLLAGDPNKLSAGAAAPASVGINNLTSEKVAGTKFLIQGDKGSQSSFAQLPEAPVDGGLEQRLATEGVTTPGSLNHLVRQQSTQVNLHSQTITDLRSGQTIALQHVREVESLGLNRIELSGPKLDADEITLDSVRLSNGDKSEPLLPLPVRDKAVLEFARQRDVAKFGFNDLEQVFGSKSKLAEPLANNYQGPTFPIASMMGRLSLNPNTTTGMSFTAAPQSGMDVVPISGVHSEASASTLSSEQPPSGLPSIGATLPGIQRQGASVFLGVAQYSDPQFQRNLGEQVLIMTGQGIQKAHISLNPQELGAVDIRVSIINDEVSVQLASQNPMVRETIQEAIPRLREMLEEAGLKLSDHDVGSQFNEKDRSADQAPNQSELLSWDSKANTDSLVPETNRRSTDSRVIDTYI